MQSLTKGFLNYEPLDMAADRVGSEQMIFVTFYWRISAESGNAVLVSYSDRGNEIRSWSLPPPGFFSGLAVDGGSGIIYLGNAETSEIYKMRIQDSTNQGPSYLLQVRGASRLGPMALDRVRQRLFVADIRNGVVYAVDLGTRRSRRLLDSLGLPTAMAFDSVDRKLYVSDAAQRRIWVVQVDSSPTRLKLFSAHKDFREPVGLAVDANRRIWVADFDTHTLFVFSPAGEIVRIIREPTASK